jgi:hypothetical protein
MHTNEVYAYDVYKESVSMDTGDMTTYEYHGNAYLGLVVIKCGCKKMCIHTFLYIYAPIYL